MLCPELPWKAQPHRNKEPHLARQDGADGVGRIPHAGPRLPVGRQARVRHHVGARLRSFDTSAAAHPPRTKPRLVVLPQALQLLQFQALLTLGTTVIIPKSNAP